MSDFPDYNECFCIGPQNGEPACPCMMKRVSIKDGRYVQDLGPAPAQGCLFENLPKYEAMGLVCTCPRCSARCTN